jgi:hypothetical protein
MIPETGTMSVIPGKKAKSLKTLGNKDAKDRRWSHEITKTFCGCYLTDVSHDFWLRWNSQLPTNWRA